MPPRFDAVRGTTGQRMAIAHEADVHGVVMYAYSLLQTMLVSSALATTVATVVSELAMNIVKYANTGGSVRIALTTTGRTAIEVWAEDSGPGIPDVGLALQDHFSSNGTLGVGLPGVKRMVDEFELHSTPGVGTSVRVKKWLGPCFVASTDQRRMLRSPSVLVPEVANESPLLARDTKPHQDVYATVNRPCFGEVLSGDCPIVRVLPTGVLIGMVDVLGHGPEAHQLALHCERWLMAQASGAVEDLLYALHRDIKGSRGAAISLAWISSHRPQQVTVAGVGNTLLYALQDKVTPISAQPGILGGNMPRLRPMVLPLEVGDVLLLTTDGISERVDSQQLLLLKNWPVRRIANEVLRVYGKAHDDAACAVLRHGP